MRRPSRKTWSMCQLRLTLSRLPLSPPVVSPLLLMMTPPTAPVTALVGCPAETQRSLPLHRMILTSPLLNMEVNWLFLDKSTSTPNIPEIPDSDAHTPRAQTKELLSQCFTTPKKISSRIVKRLDVNFGIMSAMKSASKSHPEVIPVLQGLLKEEVIEKSRLKTSLRTQMGVHNRFGDRKKPDRFAPYRKPRKDITCDTLKMKILE